MVKAISPIPSAFPSTWLWLSFHWTMGSTRTLLKFGQSYDYSGDGGMWFLKLGPKRQYRFCLISLGLSLSEPIGANPWWATHGEKSTPSHQPHKWASLEMGPLASASHPHLMPWKQRQGVSSKFCPNCRLMTKNYYYCFKPQSLGQSVLKQDNSFSFLITSRLDMRTLRQREVNELLDCIASI